MWVFVVLRLLFFAVPFAALYLLNIAPWMAAIFAALIGMSLSIIFLSRPKAEMSSSISDWRNRRKTSDEVVEDEILEHEGELEGESDAEQHPVRE